METQIMDEQITESDNREKEFAARMKSTIKAISGIVIVAYIMVVWPLLYMGITSIRMPLFSFVASTLVIPVMTFFAGVWIVWKFKFMK